jgi:phosphatidylinositol glycan class P protein
MSAGYAFVFWIMTTVSYVVFLIWIFTPEVLLHQYGITYYPSRYYALALPSYMLVTIVLGVMFYIGLNMASTFDPDDIRTVEDSYTMQAPNEFIRMINKNDFMVPEIGDMDPSIVSEILTSPVFSDKRKTAH